MFEEIDNHLRRCIESGLFPGAQYVIAERGERVAEGALGDAVLLPGPIPVTRDTIYDLASLTKPLVTALLAARFAERGRLDLAAPIATYLDEFRDDSRREGRCDITVTDLLTHTSGLDAWRPLYLAAEGRDRVVAAIAQTPRNRRSAAGYDVRYSDLNFILLGFLLERLAGERLDRLAEREIFVPLALRRTRFNPPAAWRPGIAATEEGQTYERATVARLKVVCPLPAGGRAGGRARGRQPLRRKSLIWGEVHDGNAYFLDGVAGHAGLFSTSREVVAIASQFLSGSRLLREASLSLFTRNFTAGRGDARSVGWMLAATADCSAGAALPGHAFGHTGFTGTSVWVDPDRQRVFILLTNRVHPHVRDGDMKSARQRFHALAVEAMRK